MKNLSFFRYNITILLLSALFFTSCQRDDNDDLISASGLRYLESVTAERQITKDEITDMILEYFPNLNISGPLLSSIICDVDIAAITYNTTGVDGNPTIASGVIATPSGTVQYEYILSIQHGTLDIEEAPSVKPFYYELAPAACRQVCVMADYLGYGASKTKEREHPYMHINSTGSACADMIEAAREYFRIKNIKELSDKLKLIGYSQGGTSTIAALLELDSRAEISRVAAVHAGGGAYDLELTMQNFINSGSTKYQRMGYIPYTIRGMIYGERLNVDENNIYAASLMESGKNLMFSTAPLSQWHTALGVDITQVLHPDFFAYPTFNDNKDILKIYDALKKNSLRNKDLPDVEITLYHSRTDDFVPYANATSAHERWKRSKLVDLSSPDHVSGGIEFMLRYLGLWNLMGNQ